MDGKYNNLIDEHIIIDSRYPYEFDGGHIINAMNIYTKEDLVEEMFVKRLGLNSIHNLNENELNKFQLEINQRMDKKRFIVIFHCEFSSQRGPTL